MRTRLFLLITCLLTAWMPSALAQGTADDALTVNSFSCDLVDLSAATHPREDLNGDICALVKVQMRFNEAAVSFGGNVMGDVQEQKNEYWVYLTQGTKRLKITHPNYPQLLVVFADVSNGEIKALESKMTYRLVINVPAQQVIEVHDTIVEGFDTKLAEARAMKRDYPKHAETEYYRKAVLLYEAVMNHSQCPPDMLKQLQEDYDAMRFMRKYTYNYEKQTAQAQRLSASFGATSDTVYNSLLVAYKCTRKLVEDYPTPAFKAISDSAYTRLAKHPKAASGKVAQTVTRKRIVVMGTVTLKTASMQLAAVNIYAAKDLKPAAKDLKLIGRVQADGSYRVIIPDGYSHILFDGEKKAHPVAESQTLNVEIR